MVHRISLSFSIFLVIALLLGQLVHADNEAYQRLARSKSLKCTFDKGTVGDWRSGMLKLVSDKYKGSVQFASINVKSGSARMIGNIGAGDIVVLLTPIGITFIDTSESFNTVAITTIFGNKAKSGDYIAVTSRHFKFSVPTPSQYHGTCKILE